MAKTYMSAKNPGFKLAAILFGLWLLSWVVLMGVFSEAQVAGLASITWSQIVLGVLAVLVSVIAMPIMNRWERG